MQQKSFFLLVDKSEIALDQILSKLGSDGSDGSDIKDVNGNGNEKDIGNDEVEHRDGLGQQVYTNSRCDPSGQQLLRSEDIGGDVVHNIILDYYCEDYECGK